MSKYVEKAFEYHDKGYNCAQAVMCAFADQTGVDAELLYKLSEGMGAGMGNRKNTCGALSGAIMLCGLMNSSGNVENSTKASTYDTAGIMVNEFEKRCNALTCTDIKGLNTGTPTVSCSECIKYAVEIAEEYLLKK